MFVFKNIILIMLFFSFCYMGNYKAKELENRVVELNSFQNALVMFKSKLEFTHEPLKQIFNDISKTIYKNKENIFLISLKSDLKNINLAWEESIRGFYNTNLTKEDKQIISMLGKMLGKTDISGQVSEIELSQKLIENQIKKAENEKEKNYKLYKSMGMILGAGICIIFI